MGLVRRKYVDFKSQALYMRVLFRLVSSQPRELIMPHLEAVSGTDVFAVAHAGALARCEAFVICCRPAVVEEFLKEPEPGVEAPKPGVLP